MINRQHSLQALRARFFADSLSPDAFRLAAARQYRDLGLYRRAAALLKDIDSTALAPDQILDFARLERSLDERMRASVAPACALTMIVRDEESHIGDALASADRWFDEIVICDTGSVDATLSIAEAFGVTVVRQPWKNDFSRARNAALDNAQSDWIFWMDADDRLDAQSAGALQQLWRTCSPQGAAIRIVNERHSGPGTEFLQVRLFPRRQSVRFERRVHEQIMFSLARHDIPFSRHAEITVRHLGYCDPETERAKAARNRRLLAGELRTHPGDPALRMSMGDCLYLLGNIDGALREYDKICDNPACMRKNSDIYVQAHITIGCICMRRGHAGKARAYLLQAIALDERRADALYHLGCLFEQEGQERKAADFYLRAARIRQSPRMTAANPTAIRANAIYRLVRLLLHWSRYAEAEEILAGAVETFPRTPRFHIQRGVAQMGLVRFANAMESFTAALRLDPGQYRREALAGLSQVYRAIGESDKARALLDKAGITAADTTGLLDIKPAAAACA